tara:strand:+ start:184 stop:351 length:168 start_codon:yes stop_codon:yes gene_type:complete
MLITWAFALFVSFALRQWGLQHPDPFLINPLIVWSLLIIPSACLGGWVFLVGFRK